MTVDQSVAAAAAMSDGELAAIEARLPVGGLFAAHAHTDMTRLLVEIHRLRPCPRKQGGDR